MAHILPDTPPQLIPKEVLRVYRALKTLPDSYFIWHHLAPWQVDMPDFLIFNETGQALLVKVSLSTEEKTRTASQMLLLGEEKEPLGVQENKLLHAFVSSLGIPPDQHVETLVIFPNIPDKHVQASRLARGEGEPQWVGKEIVQPESNWDAFLPSSPMDAIWLEKLRQRFTPEVVVPADMTVRLEGTRRREAGLTDYLLDYDQERAVKYELELPPDDQALPADMRLNIINGVAGSGKTLILLYRLRLLYHLYPDKRFLVLTHNRPISHDMQGRFTRLMGREVNHIEWRTFSAWCHHHWMNKPAWVSPLSLSAREHRLNEIWRSHLRDTKITQKMFQSELDWFKDQLPLRRTEYLTTDRRGRGFGLSEEMRGRMFNAFLAYQTSLKAKGELDWGDVPQRLWKAVTESAHQLPEYDFILIDEAQFFAPLWMHLIQKALNPHGHLFLVADPTQGFLGRGTSWRSLGLDARGHTHTLKKSYRTTREIMQFATLLYRLRLENEKDEDILTPDILNMPKGAFPELIPLTSPQDEVARIANEVENLVKQGLPRKHILLLHTDGNGVQHLIQALEDRLGKGSAIDPKDTFPGDYIRVTTFNAGAGLESQIVFLVGLKALFEEEQSLRLADDEREELIRDNTRKLYMAATRAGQRLVLSYSGELPETLKKVFLHG
ncbi:MAG TPA: UvrD-helicase domain-containing protein [Anaerolineales bacterium]|nr:UvrD-helicase domain-containing protein [Anaerolineales bacterium]